MPSIKKYLKFCLIPLLSLLGIWQYLDHREWVFPIPAMEYQLNHRFSPADVRNFAAPFLDLSEGALKYKVEPFADRNSVKFLQLTLSKNEFEKILQNENIPLWGWDIIIEQPVHAQLKISYQKKLIGFEAAVGPDSPKMVSKAILLTLEKKTGKNILNNLENILNTIGEKEELKFHQKVPQTNLIEVIVLNLEKGSLNRFNSSFLLPVTYASVINSEIEKQKTLHHFFNIFHYTLIALIFLFLFRAYENHDLLWKKNIYVFFILFAAQFLTFLFNERVHSSYALPLFQAFIATIGHSAWMFGLIVASDFVSRTFTKSSYSLSDLGNRQFLTSKHFRSGILTGWILFVWQLLIVGVFYKIFLHYSAYVPLKIPGEHSIYCSFEFLKYFTDSLSTSMFEEILYRLFLICFFSLVFKKIWPAIVISSVLWGFLHFSYQFEPYYIRGLELTLVGFFYGWVMVRYGILSVIIAHFLYNSFILSEYEHQAVPYFSGICLFLAGCYVTSWFFQKKEDPFIFKRAEFLQRNIGTPSSISERRNILRKIRPLNWKYGLIVLAVLSVIIFRISFGSQKTNPLANRDELTQVSSRIVQLFNQQNVWNITFHKSNPDVEKIFKALKKSPDRKEVFKLIEPYSSLWSIRYFSDRDSHILCDLDYSYEYELMQMFCPKQTSPKDLSFEEWIALVKNPTETWTLFNKNPQENGIVDYQYQVIPNGPSLITKKIFMRFKNDRLIHFKKQILVSHEENIAPKPQTKGMDFETICLSLIFTGLFLGFSRFFFVIAKERTINDKKSFWGSIISCTLYALWKINAYKETLIGVATGISLRHVIINEILFLCVKMMFLGGASYLLFFSFFEFPSRIFKHVPTSSEWNSILGRPIWKWRNAKVSLLYAALLLCIQILLGLLIQMSNGSSTLDFFHFDISFLNHEYVLITFLWLFWKNLLFWTALLVVISILENTFPRWAYLPILFFIVILNMSLSHENLDSKLVELCAIYIVFYFVYNIARFDFAFYFWFILFNTLLTFGPFVIYPQYQAYLYQIIFIFIFVFTIVAYTLIRGAKKIKPA